MDFLQAWCGSHILSQQWSNPASISISNLVDKKDEVTSLEKVFLTEGPFSGWRLSIAKMSSIKMKLKFWATKWKMKINTEVGKSSPNDNSNNPFWPMWTRYYLPTLMPGDHLSYLNDVKQCNRWRLIRPLFIYKFSIG